jgi:glycosyltransferase involved in cell wall biosynthesis
MLFPTPSSEPVDVPYAVTVWDLEHRLHPYFPELGAHGEWQARDRYYADTLRRATYVITGTTVGRDEIVRFYNVDAPRIRILPHPTPSFALAAGDTQLSLDVPRPYVFYPAQFWPHKNHIGLLHGIAELARRGTPMHVALVGSDKGNRAFVKQRAEALGIADRVHFLGFVERADLVALYRNAHALVYTSLCGPENLPPLEAMALGCPVINSDIAGAREQLGDAALLVDTLDANALADAIERVPRAALIARGRIRAARYTQTEFGKDLVAMLDDFRKRRALWL